MNHITFSGTGSITLCIILSLTGLAPAIFSCVIVPALVMHAKSLQHRGSWWALYVLGLHAVLAPIYRSLRRNTKFTKRLSQFISMVYQILTIPTGAEIPLNARLGRGIFLGHTVGVVFNGLVAVGDYCIITPGVVIGGDGRGGVPVVGKNVYIGANAVIAGMSVIGDNATIGACTTVIGREIPPFALVIGNPGKIVKENYRRTYHSYSKEAGCE